MKHYTKGNDLFKQRTREFIQEVIKCCSYEKKAIINTKAKEYSLDMNNFLDKYERKQETTEACIWNWDNEVLDKLCTTCKGFAIPEAQEIINRINHQTD